MPDNKIMDKLQWFKFSIIDWNMGKIKKVPEITQIRFINLCCLYWNKECTLSYDDAEIEIDKEHLDILISKKIVKVFDRFIYIDFLDEQMLGVYEKREERKKNAVLGNLKRWHPIIYDKVISKEITIEEAVKIIENGGIVNDSNTIAPQSLPDSDTMVTQSQNIAEKRREEKRREENIKENNIINNTAFAKICISENQWCETVCMQNKIPLGNLKDVIDDFEKHLITTGEQKKSLSEFKKHFSNWITKQSYGFNSKVITSTTNQLQPKYDD